MTYGWALLNYPYVWFPAVVVVFVVLNGLRKGRARRPTERELLYLVVSGAGLAGAFSNFSHLYGSTLDVASGQAWSMAAGSLLLGYISYRVIAEVVHSLWHGIPPELPVAPVREQLPAAAETRDGAPPGPG
jgi:hypothetical protein